MSYITDILNPVRTSHEFAMQREVLSLCIDQNINFSQGFE